MIKKVLKLIIGLVATIILIVLGLVAFVYFSIRDKTNEIPYDLYQSEINFEDEVNNLLFYSLENFSVINELNIALTEDDLNRLIFAIIRKQNPQYLPNDSCNVFGCRVVVGEEIDIPLLGKRDVAVKGAYGKFEGNDIRLYVVVDFAGVPSIANLTLNFQEKNDQYVMSITAFH